MSLFNVFFKNWFFVAFVLVFLPSAAFAADGATLGDLMCSAFVNAKPFGLVFQWVAYISGIAAALRGIYNLKLHSENAVNTKLYVPLMYLFGSALLLALPSVIGAIQASLYTPGGGGMETCRVVAPEAVETGLDNMVTSFVTNIKEPLLLIVSLVAILAGLFMVVQGLQQASKYGTDPKTYSVQKILANIGFGAMLMMIGSNVDIMLASLFGDGATASSVIGWTAINNAIGGEGVSERFQMAINSALVFVQIIGAIAFVRGWLVLKKVVEGGSQNVNLTQGLTHIIGGTLAINIGGFLTIMDKTFGTNLLN